jgi:hypothetical protein
MAAYCARYAVKPTREGLPPFPTGQRETPQHREWISLYKTHDRLARRARGLCERCSEPVAPDSVFCEAHRSDAAQGSSANPADRDRLHKAQRGRCPICADALELAPGTPVHNDRVTGKPRALLHSRCCRLVSLAETVGPAALDRLKAYLKPHSRSGPRD